MKSNLSISIHSLSNFKNGVNIVKIFFNFYYFRKRKYKASNFIFEAELVTPIQSCNPNQAADHLTTCVAPCVASFTMNL